MPTFVTSPGPFIRNPLAQTKRAMRDYTIGLLGLFAFSTGFHWMTHGLEYGLKAIGMMLTSLIITLFADMLVAALKYQSHADGRLLPYMVSSVKKSYSYVTAVLMTLTLPIGTPYFVVIMGNLFATLIVKYTFGGFGANLFNPAAFGRIFVGLAFGGQLTAFINAPSEVPSLTASGQTITTAFSNTYSNWIATSLDGLPVDNLWRLILGNYSGALGETSVLLIVILGSILTILKAHNWRPTVFFLFTLWFSAFGIALFNGINPLWYAFTFVSLGSAFFGGMFMLTDPVTSPTTNYGKALIGVIAGIVVVVVRTQTSWPEGMVYGIAVANLASPIIDKYTVGLTNQFLKQRYALLSGLMAFSVGVSVLPTLVDAGSATSIPSSSEVVITPYAVYRGQASTNAYPEAETETLLIVDVGVDRSFNLVTLDIIEGIASLGVYSQSWQTSGATVIAEYLTLNVAEVLALDPLALPSALSVTGLTVSADRLVLAVQDAFKDIDVYVANSTSYPYEEAVEEHTISLTVYVDRTNDTIVGLNITGTLASTGPYLNTILQNFEIIQDYYLGMTVDEVLALNQGPLYPGFSPTQSGVTISLDRIFEAIQLALGGQHG
jgi:Na+-translocating ferredoxin:NAD+ oxidoreductase subunit D